MASNAITYADVGAAVIYRARVLDVDMRYYVLTVHGEFLKKPLADISFATPYQHYDNGEGIYFMPEVGSLCWLCEPSDGAKPFVLAWAAASEEGDFRSKKHDLNPGDIYLGTRDENRLVLRRGGVVQIGATPLAQRIYLPINNTIQDLCENYALHTLAGDLTWTVDIEEATPDGARPATLSLTARCLANDPNPVAKLKIGSHQSDQDTILSLSLYDSGAVAQTSVINLLLTKEGKVIWWAKGKVDWTFMDEFSMEVTKDATIHSHMQATLRGDLMAEVVGNVVAVTAEVGTVALSAEAGTTVTAPAGQTALSVGTADLPVVLATDALITWLTSHTHKCVVPGGDSGPPDNGGLDTSALQSKDVLSS